MSLGWELNNRSTHEDQCVKIWVASLISCCKPNGDVVASILEPSWAVLSCLYLFDDLILRSPGTTNKYGLFCRSYLD